MGTLRRDFMRLRNRETIVLDFVLTPITEWTDPFDFLIKNVVKSKDVS